MVGTKTVQQDPKTSATILLDKFELEKKIWAVAGGKGGTGKTVITSNLGVGLAILGYKVILITLDFFAISNEGFIVCNPEPQAKIDAYAFVKNVVYRRILQTFGRNTLLKDLILNFGNSGQRALKIRDLINLIRDEVPAYGEKAQEIVDTFRPKLIMNKVRKKTQLEDARRFVYLVREYLCIEMEYLED